MNTTRSARSARILFGLYALLALPAYGGEPDVTWDERSRALADQLMSELKAELGQAMQQGGAVAAVAVCKSRAPEIAARLSASLGADVGRTAIARDYPQDTATGFETGQLRGAVTVRWPATR